MSDPQTASFALTEFSSAGRLLALDPGTKRVGVAITDELRLTIRPLAPLPRASWKKLLLDLKELVEKYQVAAIVLGLPLHLDGTSGEAVARTEEFARRLQLAFQLPIFLQDERLTSIAAADQLAEAGVRDRQRQREMIDSQAASIILRDFLAELDRSPKVAYSPDS